MLLVAHSNSTFTISSLQACNSRVSLRQNFYKAKLFVYVIVRVAVVFGINCASNAGRKLVIVQGTAEHYYCFLPALREQLIQNTIQQPVLLQIYPICSSQMVLYSCNNL